MEDEEDFLREALAAEELGNLEFLSKLPSEEPRKPVSKGLTFLKKEKRKASC